jgi:hypothetical protein
MAAIWAPVTMPPAASTGTRPATTSRISGTSTSVDTVPVCPPASLPWATIMSTPGVELAHGVLARPDQGRDRYPRPPGPLGSSTPGAVRGRWRSV